MVPPPCAIKHSSMASSQATGALLARSGGDCSPICDSAPVRRPDMSLDPKIYRYVVAYDGGTAPRPYDGICSLAICKPKIRAAAQVGDWIIGFRSRRPGDVIYVMQVGERLTLGEYWLDPRFAGRRPGGA